MEHVVFFPAADGSPAFRRVPTLDEAVRLVEHLRNVEGLSTVSVSSLTEVPLAFRAYYRVEVPTDAVPAQPQGESAPPLEAAPVEMTPELTPDAHEVDAAAPAEDAPADQAVLVTSNGHAPTTPASLGFFA